MRAQFVQTKNVMKFLAGLSKLQERGAEEACLMVVKGEPGLGKTEILEWWTTQNNAVYLRAKREWTPGWMLRELLTAMGVKDYGRFFEPNFRSALTHLQTMDMDAQNRGQTFGVVVDEADHVASDSDLLETLRDFSDITEIPFILVGMDRIKDKLQKFPQVASRVAQYVEFQKADVDDVKNLAKGLVEVEIAEDLLEFVQKQTQGYTREIMEAFMSIERFGKKNEGVVTLASMDGEVLINNRTTGQEIKVRA
ncbi:ATP-binding protein [Terasakiella sp. A23]|uniref:ATP-binding protein n=1 Tax=Terasakiella sp. FCG-A23 TaxID=3080561 RepID=UPI0029531865|nr:ATP-binding protein [Terasakiella sp. A23]MDV7341006.1 ATP-binding protein [Terasakiella sp. A23]